MQWPPLFPEALKSLNTYVPPSKKKGDNDAKCWRITMSSGAGGHAKRWCQDAGLDPTEGMVWVKKMPDGKWVPNEDLIVRFLEYMAVCHDEGSVGASVFGDTLKASKWMIDKQLSVVKTARTAQGFVRNLPGIHELIRDIDKKKATSSRDKEEDIQGDLDETLTVKQWTNIVRFLLACVPLAGFIETPLIFFMALIIMILSRVFASRGEDIRGLVVGSLAWCDYPTIGPNGHGILIVVAKGGKMTRANRRTRSGAIASKNPLLDPLSAVFMSLLARWAEGGGTEPRPDWGDGNYSTLFTPLLRSATSPDKPMDYEKHNSIAKSLLNRFDVCATMTSHFMRGDTARWLELHRINPELVKKFMHRFEDAHAMSYATNVELTSILQLGGYNPDIPEAVYAAHLSVLHSNPDLVSDVVNILLTWLPGEEEKVKGSFAAAGVHREAQMQRRLFMRRGSLRALRELAGVFLVVSTARPREAKERNPAIIADSPPMRDLFPQNHVYQFLSQGLFKTEKYLELAALVKMQEDLELGASTSNSAPVRTELEGALSGALERHIQPLYALMSGIAARQASFQSDMLSRMAALSSGNRGGVAGTASDVGDSASAASPVLEADLRDVGGSASTASPVPESDPVRRIAEPQETSQSSSSGASISLKWKSRSCHVARAKGHHAIANFSEISNGKYMYREVQRLRGLEAKGTKWRRYKGGSDAFYHRGPFIRLVARLEAQGKQETDIITSLEDLATEAGSLSSAPNWKEVEAGLRKSPEEVELRELKSTGAAQRKAEKQRRAKRKAGSMDVSAMPEDGLIPGPGHVPERVGVSTTTTATTAVTEV